MLLESQHLSLLVPHGPPHSPLPSPLWSSSHQSSSLPLYHMYLEGPVAPSLDIGARITDIAIGLDGDGDGSKGMEGEGGREGGRRGHGVSMR